MPTESENSESIVSEINENTQKPATIDDPFDDWPEI